MAQFAYQVRIGEQTVSGVMEAAGSAQAEAILRENGWDILAVSEKKPLFAGLGTPKRGKIGMGDILEFTSQLRTLLDAGLPIDRALKILINTLPHKGLVEVMRDLLLDIEKGSTLHDAFSKHPQAFPRLYINMVKAGEEGGILPITLARLIDFYERSIEFRSFLVSSSIYPAVLLVFGIGALVALTVFVIPKFAEVFDNMGKQLPPAAAFLIGLSHFLTDYGIEILLGLGTLWLAFYLYIRQPAGKLWWHQLLLKLPLVGDLMLKANLSRACRTLGTLLINGVPLIAALGIVRDAVGNQAGVQAIDRATLSAKGGAGLARPLKESGLFPLRTTDLLRLGEETAQLGPMALRAAEIHEEKTRLGVQRLVALLVPAITIVMGVAIAGIVSSLLLAMLGLNDLAAS